MLKRVTVWGAALAVIVVAVLLVMRMGPDGAPDASRRVGTSTVAAADWAA